jgi:hypothetical protein
VAFRFASLLTIQAANPFDRSTCDESLLRGITVEVKIDRGVLMKAMLDDSKSEYS